MKFNLKRTPEQKCGEQPKEQKPQKTLKQIWEEMYKDEF